MILRAFTISKINNLITRRESYNETCSKYRNIAWWAINKGKRPITKKIRHDM
jgi:hypothetical protein